jgi:hypothetical protein
MEQQTYKLEKGTYKRSTVITYLTHSHRYANMDYIAFSAMRASPSPFIVFTYDIACQWSRSVHTRAMAFESGFRVRIDRKRTRFAIPKFHQAAHGPDCQTKFSLNFMRDVGRTYGEGVESVWAHVNATAWSTREMSPAFRHETLNAHFMAWNWSKILGFGSYFSAKLKEAVSQASVSARDLDDFERVLSPQDISVWSASIDAWESGTSDDDPYVIPEHSTYFL